MKKTYSVLLDRYSDEPNELRKYEHSIPTERFSINFDGVPEGEMIAQIPAANMLLAFARAQELRQQIIDSGKWDILAENFKNSD